MNYIILPTSERRILTSLDHCLKRKVCHFILKGKETNITKNKRNLRELTAVSYTHLNSCPGLPVYGHGLSLVLVHIHFCRGFCWGLSFFPSSQCQFSSVFQSAYYTLLNQMLLPVYESDTHFFQVLELYLNPPKSIWSLALQLHLYILFLCWNWTDVVSFLLDE